MCESPDMFTLSRSLALLVTIFSVTLVHAENLLPNPGFEADQEGWGLFLPADDNGAPVEFSVTQQEPRTGSASGILKTEEPRRYAITAKKSFTVSPGEKYRIQAWVKFSKDARLEGEHPAAYIRATLAEASRLDIPDPLGHIHIGLTGDVVRNPLVGKLGVPQLPSGWRKIEAVVEIPPDTAFLGVSLFVHGVVGTIFWDDVSFELVDPKTPLSKVLE